MSHVRAKNMLMPLYQYGNGHGRGQGSMHPVPEDAPVCCPAPVKAEGAVPVTVEVPVRLVPWFGPFTQKSTPLST